MMEDGPLLPSVFVLLPNKSEVTYRRMWQQVQLLCPLEKAAIHLTL